MRKSALAGIFFTIILCPFIVETVSAQQTQAPAAGSQSQSGSSAQSGSQAQSSQPAAQSQLPTDWYQNKPIQNITFKGLKTVSQTELDGIVQPFIGKRFTDSLFLDLQRRLYALGYFDEIVPRAVPADSQGNAVILEFDVTEHPVVNQIKIDGNARVRTQDILDKVVLKPGDMITDAKIRLDEDAIRALYQDRGFPNATVSGKSETTPDGKTNVVFTIDEGNQTVVKEIRFSGNTYASDSTLRGLLKTKEQSLFNPGTYRESDLEQDKTAIQQYYWNHGYVDAKVTDINKDFTVDKENKRSTVVLTFYVSEGTQYTYGGISFKGNTIFSNEDLAKLVPIKSGAILDKSKVDEGYKKIQSLYFSNGYVFNQISLDEHRDEATKTISYTVNIVEQNRAHIEDVIIKGNTKTKDYVIRRELPFEQGDIFSVAKIQQGLQNLANLQYFSSINPEYPTGTVPGLIDVVLNVEEANTAAINFGVSFGGSTQFPISGNLGWSDSNFRGMGENIGVTANVSPIDQKLTFNYTEPWLFGQRWSGGLNLAFERATISGQPQDILYPIFQSGDPNAVPDPFTGAYVFSKKTEYPTGSGTYYQAGDYFPGPVNSTTISDYSLETDYQQAGGTTSIIPSSYLMSYVNWNISLGANTGYRFQTHFGQLGLGSAISTTAGYVDYNAAINRPFDASLRASHQQWLFTNKLSLSASLDTRDYVLSPSSGYYLSENLTYAGGLLFGNSHFITTATTAEAYLTLFDLPVFHNWNWKEVLAVHSAFSVIFPQFWLPPAFASQPGNPIIANSTDYLYIDGMFVGRGWPQESGQALWDNWVELRMPVVPQVFWLDGFFDAVQLWQSRKDINMFDLSNFKFGFGLGIRFTIPQFPIRLYLAKRFQVVNGQIQWEQGSVFPSSIGLDFVFSIGTSGFF